MTLERAGTVSHMLSARKIRILGTGHALPSGRIPSSDLDHRLGHPPGTVERASGVRERFFAARSETAATLAASAARLAVGAANLELDGIDCIVAASATMDQGMPCNASLIHRELELDPRIPAFDINMSCLGFLAAFDALSFLVAGGRYRRVLIVAADLASCGLNWEHLESSAIFGDGSAAAVIGLSAEEETSRILASDLMTVSAGAELCKIPAGGSRFHPSRIDVPFSPLTVFHMEGKQVFKMASQHLPSFLSGLLKKAGLALPDIDIVIPHQASQLALSHLTKRLELPEEKVVDIFSNHGNQVAASLPTALDIAARDGRLQRGHKALLLGTGAGLSFGGMILEY